MRFKFIISHIRSLMQQRHLRGRHPTQTKERDIWGEVFKSRNFVIEWVVGAEGSAALLEEAGYCWYPL